MLHQVVSKLLTRPVAQAGGAYPPVQALVRRMNLRRQRHCPQPETHDQYGGFKTPAPPRRV